MSSANLPAGVAAFLNRVDRGGKVLNDPNTGGYLQWMLYPKYKIFMDMEVPFLFTDEDMVTAVTMFGDRQVLSGVLARYEPDFITVRNNDRGFKRVMEEAFPHYTIVFFDDHEVLYVDSRKHPDLAREFELRGHTVVGLSFIGHDVALAEGDTVVLAVPHRVAGLLLPDVTVPEGSRSIVNAHFRLPAAVPLRDGLHFLALLNGTAHWLFFRDDVVSATVSAAEALVDLPAEEIAGRIWADVARAVDAPAGPLPPHRIVKEKTATFAQTPAEVARRPAAKTAYFNLFLAGDWTATGLPATIEGALRSGRTAARLVLAQRSSAGVPMAGTRSPQRQPAALNIVL